MAVLMLLAGSACATRPDLLPQPIEEPASGPVASVPPVRPPPPCAAFARPGTLRRSVLNAVLDKGLGRWLAGVEVEPRIQQGQFRGWIVRSLYPDNSCYREVDLRPGDLVLRVNGKGIERPEEANDVFAGLRLATALVVEYERNGAPGKLTLSIADE
jgi:hypothetical protein